MVSGERLEGSEGGRKVEFIMSRKERGEEGEEGRAYVADKGLRMSRKEGAEDVAEGEGFMSRKETYVAKGEDFMSRKDRGGEAERGWRGLRGKEGRVP